MSTALRRYYRGHNLVTMRDVQANASRHYHFDHQGTTQCLTDSASAVTDRFSSDAWGVQVTRTGSSINRHWFVGNSGYQRSSPAHTDYVRARWLATASGSWLARDPAACHVMERGGSRYLRGFVRQAWSPPFTRRSGPGPISIRCTGAESPRRIRFRRPREESSRCRSDASTYAYCYNNPTVLIDPSGTVPMLCIALCAPCLSCGIALGAACSDCGTDSQCWGDCISGTIENLPPSVQGFCGVACGGCLLCLLEPPNPPGPKPQPPQPPGPQPPGGPGRQPPGGPGRPPGPGRQPCPPCTPAEIAALNAWYHGICESNPRRCTPADFCGALWYKGVINQQCALARMYVSERCYGGNLDPNHLHQINEAIRLAAGCAALFASQGCIDLMR